jgi:hypothetical protein
VRSYASATAMDHTIENDTAVVWVGWGGVCVCVSTLSEGCAQLLAVGLGQTCEGPQTRSSHANPEVNIPDHGLFLHVSEAAANTRPATSKVQCGCVCVCVCACVCGCVCVCGLGQRKEMKTEPHAHIHTLSCGDTRGSRDSEQTSCEGTTTAGRPRRGASAAAWRRDGDVDGNDKATRYLDGGFTEAVRVETSLLKKQRLVLYGRVH